MAMLRALPDKLSKEMKSLLSTGRKRERERETEKINGSLREKKFTVQETSCTN